MLYKTVHQAKVKAPQRQTVEFKCWNNSGHTQKPLDSFRNQVWN